MSARLKNEQNKQLLSSLIREKFDKTEDTGAMEELIDFSARMGLTDLAVQMQSDMYFETEKHSYAR